LSTSWQSNAYKEKNIARFVKGRTLLKEMTLGLPHFEYRHACWCWGASKGMQRTCRCYLLGTRVEQQMKKRHSFTLMNGGN
jgi:hypothetical protein